MRKQGRADSWFGGSRTENRRGLTLNHLVHYWDHRVEETVALGRPELHHFQVESIVSW
jgi:hypothetical protein